MLRDGRKQYICDKILEQIEGAGLGGFAALVFFGEIRFQRPPPLGLRLQASLGRIVFSTQISKLELLEFREEITPEMKQQIHAAKKKWNVAIQEVWKQDLARLDAKKAAAKQ